MPLRVKNGALGTGAWVTVADGDVALKWTGTSWLRPAMVRVKNGAIGGGSWVDSDYRGYPAAPTGLAVNAWATHEAVSFKWTAGVGGAAVSTYEVMVRNEAGTTPTTGAQIALKSDTASPSVDFTEVVQSTKYNVYVRAKAASGLYSAWVGPLQIKMGTDSSTYQTTETATRAYSKAASVTGYKDAAVGPVIPTSVKVQSIRYQITNGFTGAMSPYNNREIRRWGNGAAHEQFSWLAQTVDVTVNVADYTSTGGVQGLQCLGAGWSTSAGGPYVVTGTITVTGIETYSYLETHTIPAVANSYW